MTKKDYIWVVVDKNKCPLNAPHGNDYVAGWQTRREARRDKKDAENGDEENGPFYIVKYIQSK